MIVLLDIDGEEEAALDENYLDPPPTLQIGDFVYSYVADSGNDFIYQRVPT